MSRERSTDLLTQVRTLFGPGAAAGVPDHELLGRFVRRSRQSAEELAAAEAAFQAIVARHGPMVLGVCRRSLDAPEDIEDAFQATFLVLVRRGGSVRVEGSLGRWLYGVARKVAARARIRALRQKGRLRPLEDAPEPIATADRHDELFGVLDEEVARLPLRYRTPVILCHLEGLTQAEAAARLHCPVGTVSGRLTRARGLLRERLVRRGVSISAGSLATYLDSGHARADVPEFMAIATERAAARLATVGILPTNAALSLMNEAAHTATAVRLGLAATVVLAVCLAGYLAAVSRGRPIGSLANAEELAKIAPQVAGTKPTAQVSSATIAGMPPRQRPADEIVKEIEATLVSMGKERGLSDRWKQGHGDIARLVQELRTAYPDDPRLTRLLLNRWSSLAATGFSSQAYDESAATARTATDPGIRTSALFYEAHSRMRQGIGSPAAAALAEEFAHRAPGDIRAAGLLVDASEYLQIGKRTRLGLSVACLLAAGLFAIGRKFLTRAARLGKLVLIAMLVVVLGIQVVEEGGLRGFASNAYKTDLDSGRIERIAASFRSIESGVADCLQDMPRGAEALLLPTVAAVIAAAAIAARGRRRPPEAASARRARLRPWAMAFFLSLAAVCLVDVGRLATMERALVNRVARDYPQSLRGRHLRAVHPTGPKVVASGPGSSTTTR